MHFSPEKVNNSEIKDEKSENIHLNKDKFHQTRLKDEGPFIIERV